MNSQVMRKFFSNQAGALLAGSGTSESLPETTTLADKSFLKYYTACTSLTGTSRGLYWSHQVKNSGEAGRFKTIITGAANDVHGVHGTIEINGGTITGEAAGGRFNIVLPAGVFGGQTCGLYAELYANTATSDLTAGSIARFTLGGDGTGVGLLDHSCALFSIEGNSIGAAAHGHIVDAISGDKAVTHLARIRINGVPYYIMLRNAV
jgi:hypothetical protein